MHVRYIYWFHVSWVPNVNAIFVSRPFRFTGRQVGGDDITVRVGRSYSEDVVFSHCHVEHIGDGYVGTRVGYMWKKRHCAHATLREENIHWIYEEFINDSFIQQQHINSIA